MFKRNKTYDQDSDNVIVHDIKHHVQILNSLLAEADHRRLTVWVTTDNIFDKPAKIGVRIQKITNLT